MTRPSLPPEPPDAHLHGGSVDRALQLAMEDFPEDERDFLVAQNIQSLVVVPIFVNSLWWGFIGFDECKAERQWSASEIGALEAAASTLGTTIHRKRISTARPARPITNGYASADRTWLRKSAFFSR